jgi:hypothetical protein
VLVGPRGQIIGKAQEQRNNHWIQASSPSTNHEEKPSNRQETDYTRIDSYLVRMLSMLRSIVTKCLRSQQDVLMGGY